MYDCAPQGGLGEVVVAGQVAHQGSGKRIARPGRVGDPRVRISRNGEDRVVRPEKESAMFALFDHYRFGSEREEVAGTCNEILLARVLAHLRVIEEDQMRLAKHLGKGIALLFDPQVPRVNSDKTSVLRLLQNLQLKGGLNVRNEQILALAVMIGEAGM